MHRSLLAGLIPLLTLWPGATAAAQQMPENGRPAPAFSATDSHGRTRSLAEFRGQWVVLEWWNRECPYVVKHYRSGNMQRLQRDYTGRGVVWLTIVSSAPGKQGYVTPEQANQTVAEQTAVPTAVLLDPTGVVGHLYGARNTPQMYVINPQGVVLYGGAIDDRPSARLADIEGAHNYLSAALEEAMAGRPVTTPRTEPYGCTVKY